MQYTSYGGSGDYQGDWRQMEDEQNKSRASALAIMLEEQKYKQAEAEQLRQDMINKMLEQAMGRPTTYRSGNAFTDDPGTYTPEQRQGMQVFQEGRPADTNTLEMLKRQQLELPQESPQELEARQARLLGIEQQGTMDVQKKIAERAETSQLAEEKRATDRAVIEEEKAVKKQAADEKKALIANKNKAVIMTQTKYGNTITKEQDRAREEAKGRPKNKTKILAESASYIKELKAQKNEELAVIEAGHQAEMASYGYASPIKAQTQVANPVQDIQTSIDSVFNRNQQSQLGITPHTVNKYSIQYGISPDEVLQTIYETYLVGGGQ